MQELSVQSWADMSNNRTNPNTGYWNTPTPNFAVDNSRPILTLNGSKTEILHVGDNYVEQGARALDYKQDDISNKIVITGHVDTSMVGDYLLSYTVSDTRNNAAIARSRIVRVQGEEPVAFTPRPVGSGHSHLGYLEQLPADYGQDPQVRYPVLIYHHGGGGDASSLDSSPLDSLLSMSSLGGGPASLAMSGDWDPASPLIALSPQRSRFSPPNFKRIDVFVDYVIHNYQVDPSRIYMTGHSQGGFVAWRYATDYPQKVAAIAPLAAGFFAGGIPNNLCDAAEVPIWAFHSIDDNVVSVETGRRPIELLAACSNSTKPAKFTTFDGLGHQSHNYVLSLQGMGKALSTDDLFDQNLYSWLMSQHISKR